MVEAIVSRGNLEEVLNGKTAEKLNGLGKTVTTLINFTEKLNAGKKGENQVYVNGLETKMGLVPNVCDYEVRVYDNYPTDCNPRVSLVAIDTYNKEEITLMCLGEMRGKIILAGLHKPEVPVVAYLEFETDVFDNPKVAEEKFVDFLIHPEIERHSADAGGHGIYEAFSSILFKRN